MSPRKFIYSSERHISGITCNLFSAFLSSLCFDAKQKQFACLFVFGRPRKSSEPIQNKLMFLINPEINLLNAFEQNKSIGSMKHCENS